MKYMAPILWSLRGRASTWLSLGIIVAVGAIGPVGSVLADRQQFQAIAGNWAVVYNLSPKELAFTHFQIQPNGLIPKYGLVGRGMCWRPCYTLHDVHTGRTYDVLISRNRQVMTVTAAKPLVTFVAMKQGAQ